ncbi:hypothetical protein ACWCPQ_26845 [Nocardia sp. NPDC001965]
MAADLFGRVLWHGEHPATAEQYTKLLADAVAVGVIGAGDCAELSGVTPIEGVAAIRARLVTAGRRGA